MPNPNRLISRYSAGGPSREVSGRLPHSTPKMPLLTICFSLAIAIFSFVGAVDATLLGETGFEGSGWKTLVVDKPGNLQIVDDNWYATGRFVVDCSPGAARTGNCAGTTDHPYDEADGTIALGQNPHSPQVYLRYYIKYGATFDFPYGIKMHFIGDGDWTLRPEERFSLTMDTWGPPNDGTPGKIDDSTHIGYYGQYNSDGLNFNLGTPLQRNRWYCVESQIILNTPGKSDGIVRIWLDGKLAEWTGVNMRGNSTRNGQVVWIGGPYSNSNGGQNPIPQPEAVSRRWFDDIVITDGQRVGCLPDIADKTAPLPPTGVRIQ